MLWVLICKVHIIIVTVYYYHVTYEFLRESTLYSLPECQEAPCSKQAPHLKFKWQQREILLWQLPQMKLINNEVNVYYLDNKWKTIVFTFCAVANCPPPEIVMKKRRGKEQEMYLITYSMRQGFCELLTNLMFMIVSLLRLDNDFLLLVSRKSSSISFFLWT